jgi:hypothetical protein
MPHQGAGGRVRAAASAMRINADVAFRQSVWLTQTGFVVRPVPPAEAMPPEIERRSSSLSSDDFAGFLLGAAFALLDGFCFPIGIRISWLASDLA